MTEPARKLDPDPAKTEAFDLEAFLPYRLSVLSNTVSEGIAATYRSQHGLSMTEWRVVAILGRFPGLTASDVTGRGAMQKVPVSRAVTRLAERGLVKREADSEDRRRQSLRLTARGVALFNDVVPAALAYERELRGALSEREAAQLDRLLGKLLDSARTLED